MLVNWQLLVNLGSQRAVARASAISIWRWARTAPLVISYLLIARSRSRRLNCEGRSSTTSDRLKLNPDTTFVVQVESVIDVQGVQHTNSIQMLTHPDTNPVQQGLTSVNRREPVFPFGASRTRRRVRAVPFGRTNYDGCLHLSE